MPYTGLWNHIANHSKGDNITLLSTFLGYRVGIIGGHIDLVQAALSLVSENGRGSVNAAIDQGLDLCTIWSQVSIQGQGTVEFSGRLGRHLHICGDRLKMGRQQV